MAYDNQRESDPLISYQFRLDVSGKITGFFQDVSGIGSETTVVSQDITDSNGRAVVQKIPGRLVWTDVTLSRGITSNTEIWDWRKEVEDGKMNDARRNCSIVLLDAAGQPAAQWDFVSAWPSKVTGPEIKAGSNDFAVEQVTLVHEGMTRVEPA
jgi:phage tail-like protein